MIHLMEMENPGIDDNEYDNMEIDELFNKAVNYEVSTGISAIAYYLFKKVVERDPDYIQKGRHGSDNAYYWLGNIYFSSPDLIDTDMLDTTIALYSKAIELSPTHGEAYLNRGYVFQSIDEHAKAIDDFNQALIYEDSTPKEIIEEAIEISQKGLAQKFND